MTPLEWARSSFADIKAELSGNVVREAELTFVLEPVPSDGHEVRVRLNENPVDPALHVTSSAKDNLLPTVETGETPRFELTSFGFVALDVGGENIQWVPKKVTEPFLGTKEVAEVIRKLL